MTPLGRLPWLRRMLPAIVLAGFCGWFFFPLLTGHTFTTVTAHYEATYPWRTLGTPYHDVPQSDQADLTYPWRSFIHRELGRGSWPLWNPYSFGGEPFFANGSSGMLYPPNLLAALVLTPDRAHDAVSVLHVFLSGLFMYVLMREWRVSAPGAMVSAVAWMLSSFNLAWLHLEVVAPMAAWLPAALWLSSRAIRRDEWLSALAAAAALAGVLISGHLLFGGLVYGAAVIYATGLSLGRMFGFDALCDESFGVPVARGAATGRLAVIVLGPFLLAAATLLPTGLYLVSLGRASVSYEQVHEAIRVPYQTFRTMLFPPPLPVTEVTMHGMVFAGIVTPFLAMVGFFRRGPGTLISRLLIVTIFLVATDTVLLKVAYTVFPPFSFFSPLGRLLNFFTFGVAALAGIGFDTLARRISRPRVTAVLACAVVGITGWQLVSYGRAINPPFVPREARWLFPKTALIQALEALGAMNGTAPGRILPLRQSQQNGWTPPTLYAAQPVVFGIDSASGYDSTLPPRAETVLRVLAGEDLADVLARTYRRAFTTSFEIDRVRFALLPRLGVTTLVAPPGLSADPLWTPARYAPLQPRLAYGGEDGEVYLLTNASGGPWLVHNVETVATADEAAARFVDPSFDHTRAMIVERSELDDVSVPAMLPPGDTSGAVSVDEDGINTMRAVTTTQQRGWVVAPIVWDRGWTATVNGRPAPVLRANYLFLAVPVPAGESTLALQYVPPGLYAGLAVSTASLALALGMIVRRVRNRPGVVVS